MPRTSKPRIKIGDMPSYAGPTTFHLSYQGMGGWGHASRFMIEVAHHFVYPEGAIIDPRTERTMLKQDWTTESFDEAVRVAMEISKHYNVKIYQLRRGSLHLEELGTYRNGRKLDGRNRPIPTWQAEELYGMVLAHAGDEISHARSPGTSQAGKFEVHKRVEKLIDSMAPQSGWSQHGAAADRADAKNILYQDIYGRT